MRTTLRGHPYRMALVARHHSPGSLKALCSYRYMASRARSVPRSMPSSRATCRTTARSFKAHWPQAGSPIWVCVGAVALCLLSLSLCPPGAVG